MEISLIFCLAYSSSYKDVTFKYWFHYCRAEQMEFLLQAQKGDNDQEYFLRGSALQHRYVIREVYRMGITCITYLQ